MTNKYKYTSVICGASALLLTVLFYLLAFDEIFTVPMRWVSLLCLIFAELIGIVKAFTLKQNAFGAANVAASAFHTAAVIVISAVFMWFFPLLLKAYIFLNVLFLCILTAVDLTLVNFANHVEAQDREMSLSRSAIGACIDKAASLCVEYGDTDHINGLKEIRELLKYSDNSRFPQDDMTVMDGLDELERLLQNNDDGIDQKIDELKKAVKLRSVKVAASKRGSY